MTRYIKSGSVTRVPEINSELEKIATAQTKFLSRSGEAPNEMLSGLDMNNNKIFNVLVDTTDDTSLVNRGFIYSKSEVDGKDTDTLQAAREYAQTILGQNIAYGTNVAFFESFGAVIGTDTSVAFQAYLDSNIPILDLQGVNWEASSINVDNNITRTALQSKFITNGTVNLSNALAGNSLARDKSSVRKDALEPIQTKSPIVDWDGLRVLWLGTSIPHQGAGVDSYPERLSVELGFEVVNKAWSGSTASYDKNGDAFNVETIKSLSMTEADRLAGLATYGASSAYDDSFNNINKPSALTVDARIKAIFEDAPVDVVVLDHNHNDRKLVTEYTKNNKTISAVAIGTTTVFTVANTTGLEVGDGCYVRVTGIANLDYAAGRIQALTATTVTVAMDSTGFTGTFSSGTLVYTDRNTLNGCFDFLIAYTKNMGIINGTTDVKIILCNAPSYYTNNVDEDHSIWSVGYNISKIAERWGLTYYDVANDLEVVFSDHLTYLPDTVHPSTPETRKIFTDYWGKWMTGGAGTLVDKGNFLATNRNITNVHDNIALFSKYDQTYSYRESLFVNDTAVIDDDFTSGIGSWTPVGATPTTGAAPWDASETAVLFSGLATNAASYLSQVAAGGSVPVFEFDFYLTDTDIATGVSNQLAIASIVGVGGAAYTVSLVQTVGGGLFLRGTYNREGFGQAPLAVFPANLFEISPNTKYRVSLDIIDGYVNFTVNGTLIYAGRIFNEILGAITTYQIGLIFSNMGSAFPFYIGNVIVAPKITTPNRSYDTLLKTAQEFETFAEMSLVAVPEGRRVICRERGNAEYIVQPSGYVSLAGDVTLADGLIGALQLELSNLKLEQFGAKGDGITDDTSAIIDAISRGSEIRGACINLEPKRYEYTSFTIDRPIRFTGINDITQLRTSLTTGTKVLVTTTRQCIFENIIFSGASPQVSGEYVRIDSGATQNPRTHFNNCVFAACYDAIVTVTCVSLRLTNNYFVSYQRRALTIENTIINDAGNHVLSGNTFDAGAETDGVAIYQKNSGGLRCVSNKFLAGAYHYLAEIIETGASPLATSVLLFNGNSFENCTNAAIGFNAVSPYTFRYLVVTGNQFTLFGAKGFYVSPAGYQYINEFIISDNLFNLVQDGATSIDLSSCNHALIGDNIHLGNGINESGIVVASDCSNITIGTQKFNSVSTNYSINVAATGIFFSGSISEKGVGSGVTSLTYEALYASAAIPVAFTSEFPVLPFVNVTPKTTGGILSVAITNLTTMGFTAVVYGVSNGGSVSFDWEARL